MTTEFLTLHEACARFELRRSQIISATKSGGITTSVAQGRTVYSAADVHTVAKSLARAEQRRVVAPVSTETQRHTLSIRQQLDDQLIALNRRVSGDAL